MNFDQTNFVSSGQQCDPGVTVVRLAKLAKVAGLCWLGLGLSACSVPSAESPSVLAEQADAPVSDRSTSRGELIGALQRQEYRADDDLLSAGLGLEGLRAPAPPSLADPLAPSDAELRRRAMWANWRGIADLRSGEHGESYGSLQPVSGVEVRAHGRLIGSAAEHHMLFQLPDGFNFDRPCLVVTAASGSRSEYGAIALASGWGLPRGCAVVHTDKGAGTYWLQIDDVVQVTHANSGMQPDAHWGKYVLAAAEFGLEQINNERIAAGKDAPENVRALSADNTMIIALGVSNGGGAVLQAAGIDGAIFDAVVAIAPNVLAGEGGRPLFDYASEAALLMPCALKDARFENVPFARPQPLAAARCAHLAEHDLIDATGLEAQSAQALALLREGGWSDEALEVAAFSSAFDFWRAVAVTYASSYLAADAKRMPCGYRFEWRDADGLAGVASPTQQKLWWSDSSGIPPSVGVVPVDPSLPAAPQDDPAFPGLICLRDLWNAEHGALRASIEATRASLPPENLPIYVAHGSADGLVPMAFSSAPYIAWLRANGRNPVFETLKDAQHFDAFVGLPAWAGKHPPLMPRAYAMLDRAVAELGSTPAD